MLLWLQIAGVVAYSPSIKLLIPRSIPHVSVSALVGPCHGAISFSLQPTNFTSDESFLKDISGNV
jgi:hypothetical protein